MEIYNNLHPIYDSCVACGGGRGSDSSTFGFLRLLSSGGWGDAEFYITSLIGCIVTQLPGFRIYS